MNSLGPLWSRYLGTVGALVLIVFVIELLLPAEHVTAEKGGSKAQWIRQMWAYLAARPYVTSMIWFNLVKEANWRIDSSRSAERAFAGGARSDRVN